MSGKGDTRRPGDAAAYRDGWARIFTAAQQRHPRADVAGLCEVCGSTVHGAACPLWSEPRTEAGRAL